MPERLVLFLCGGTQTLTLEFRQRRCGWSYARVNHLLVRRRTQIALLASRDMQPALARLRRMGEGGGAGLVDASASGVGVRAVGCLSAAGALLFATVFFGSGLSGDRLFWVGSAALVLAGLMGALVLVGGGSLPRLEPAGLVFLAALSALAGWAGWSLAWSVAPDLSWGGFDRAVVFVAYAVVGILVGTLVPRAPRIAAGGLALLLGAVLGWALLGKIFPALYAEPPGSPFTRLRNPIGYWNALALLADGALLLALWIASPRRHSHGLRAIGALLLYAAVIAVLLTSSRTGIAVGAAAFVAWLALVPHRLESLAVAAIAGVPAVAVSIFAFTRSGLSSFDSHSARVHDGAWFGLLLTMGAVLASAAAVALSRWQEREEPLGDRRRQFERRLAAGIALAATAAVIGMAFRAGGPSDWWRDFSNPVAVQGSGGLGSTGSSGRWAWWGEAWRLFEAEPIRGHGASSFAVARRPIRNNELVVTEPHNTALQFLSELGIVGLLLAAAAAAAALAAAAAAMRRASEGDRLPALALTLGLWIYLAHALVDFDWEFVAVTGPTLFVAGLLAATARPALAQRRRLVPAGIAVVAMLASLYSLGAPWLAGRRVDESYAALDVSDVETAVSKARSAHDLNPLSYQPYWALAAAALVAGDSSAARVAYEKAAILQPENSETWFVLGQYEYRTGRFARACYALDLAYRLDPRGPPGKPGGLLDRVKKRLPGCPGSTPLS